MSTSRRDFLSTLGVIISGAFIPQNLNSLAFEDDKFKAKNIAIQVWSVKEDMLTNTKNTIAALGKMGYQCIENFEGSKGLFWGYTPEEYERICSNNGLKILSSHCNIMENFEAKVEQSAKIGIKYLICPWLGPQKSIDDFKKAAEKFNVCGKICQQHGLRFAYHNHDYSFQPLDGQIPQDVMMKETDAALVDFEMDVYWVYVAGQDPFAWIKKYPNRFTLTHIKDRKKTAKPDNKFDSGIIGRGVIPYQQWIPQFKAKGVVHFIVEQEEFSEGTPLYCAEKNFMAMKHIL